MAMDSFAQVQAAKRQRMEMEQQHVQDMKKMDVDTERERVSMAVGTADEQIKQLQSELHELEMKIVDAPTEKLEILQKIYDSKTEQLKIAQAEATKRQLGTAGGEAAEAFMHAEGQKHNMETYQQSEDRDRQHQVNMTEQTANIIEASKRNVPQVVGGGYAAPQQQPSVNVVTVQQDGGGTQQAAGSGTTCPSCGEEVQPGWKACPACGNQLQ